MRIADTRQRDRHKASIARRKAASLASSRLDPAIYLAAITTLTTVVALACVGPTLRALRVQAVEVLRAE